jgi:hypothetical protein
MNTRTAIPNDSAANEIGDPETACGSRQPTTHSPSRDGVLAEYEAVLADAKHLAAVTW